VDEGWGGFSNDDDDAGDDERAQEFATLVSSIQARAQPSLYFGHFLLPHMPWSLLPSGQEYTADPEVPGQVKLPSRVGKGWIDDPWPAIQGYQRLILQTRFLDGLIGDLIDHLEGAGLYDETVLIVTADHGVSFRQGQPRRADGPPGHHETLHVPLFVKPSGQSRGEINDAPVETVDVVPTLMDLIGAPLSGFDGRPAFDLAADEVRPRQLMTPGKTKSLHSDWRDARRVARGKYRVFGSESGSLNPWHIAPPGTAELIGRRVGPEMSRGGGPTASLDDPTAWDDVDPRGPSLPALLSGRLRSTNERRRQTIVAVAMNGRIVSVTRTLGTGSTRDFYAMIPPASLVEGDNAVELFSVDDQTLSLTRLTVTD
jgi:hypothetical protein